jgi:hypothetical protein
MVRDVRPFCLSFLARRHGAGGVCLGAQEAGGALIQETEILQQKFAELLGWEKTKRRERIFSALCCYSLIGALVVLPFHAQLLAAVGRVWVLPVIFLVLAPWLIFEQRWRARDSARALADLDKALRLDERAVTAWEILGRRQASAAETLVIRQAAEQITALEPRTLFQRQWSWRHYLVLPLFALWLALLWLEVGVSVDHNVGKPTAQALARQLREYSRELQERAQREKLSDSLQAGRELEKAAQKGINEKTGDEKFKNDLAGLAKKLEALGKPSAEQSSFSLAESEQNLKDLRAELEAARDLLNFPEAAKGPRDLEQQWLDRLAMLPQLKRQLDQENQLGQTFRQNEVRSFLDKLDKQSTSELDRRTLLEAQQFLDQLMKQGQGDKGESNARVAGRGEQDSAGDTEKEKSRGNLPGKEPGKKESYGSAPELKGGAETHVKGMLDAGDSSSLVFKGKPSAGKSEVSQDEVIASYRRQAEAELNTERVPEALKEMIKNYFMSLGMGEGKK